MNQRDVVIGNHKTVADESVMSDVSFGGGLRWRFPRLSSLSVRQVGLKT